MLCDKDNVRLHAKFLTIIILNNLALCFQLHEFGYYLYITFPESLQNSSKNHKITQHFTASISSRTTQVNMKVNSTFLSSVEIPHVHNQQH